MEEIFRFKSVLFYLLLICCVVNVDCDDEIWRKDMTEEIYIATSHEGFEYVNLTCSKEKIEVFIKMEDDPEFGAFDGIFYTRGSFSTAKPPCFFDAKGTKNERVQLTFRPTECQNVKLDEDQTLKLTDESTEKSYVNVTVIVQNDDFLIFPGDLAFEIGCRYDDEVPEASIGLADPDPAAKEMPKHKKSTVTSKTGFVRFFPDDIRPRKKPSKKGRIDSGKKVDGEKKKRKKEGKKTKTKKKKTATKTEL